MDKYITCDESNFSRIRFLKEFILNHNGFICGGCFKNIFSGERAKDLDVFFRSEVDFLKAVRAFEEEDSGYHIYYENAKVKAYKHKETGTTVELIRKIYGTPQEILEQFDFTVVKFAYFREEVPVDSPFDDDLPFSETDHTTRIEYRVIYHEKFFEHFTLKRLVVDDKMPFPASTLERIIRYAKYGYAPCRETKMKLISGIRNMSEGEASVSASLYDGMD